MKKTTQLNAAFVISLLVFNYFFWKENLGINLLVFALLLITFLLFNYKEAFNSKNVKITLAGTIVTSLMVLFFNSTASKIAQISSFLLMVAFIHESGLRSVLFAAMHLFRSFIRVPVNFIDRKNEELKKFPRLNFILRIARLSLIPLGIAFIFFMLYSNANPIFGNYADLFLEGIFKNIAEFFRTLSIGRILFLVLGAFILSVIYFRSETGIILARELSYSEKLSRIRKIQLKKNKPLPFGSSNPGHQQPFKSIELKNQNRRGVILLIMVNLLLFAENMIDINWLWFGFELPEGFSLQHYVREGTGFLIVSILLSITLLLYYFRRNQNFYSRNKILKTLAYIWIIQNLVLCISVFLRNYHYVDFHGLAYKRIGVFVFLALTVFGLVTVLLKIRDIKSVYFLLRMNTWAVYVIIVMLSCFNWDVRIAEYNLTHWNKGEIDVDFYLDLSDKALPVVYENLANVKEQIETHNHNKIKWITYLDYDVFVRDLHRKRDKFLEQYNRHSWLSYNIPDKNAFEKLSRPQLSSSE